MGNIDQAGSRNSTSDQSPPACAKLTQRERSAGRSEGQATTAPRLAIQLGRESHAGSSAGTPRSHFSTNHANDHPVLDQEATEPTERLEAKSFSPRALRSLRFLLFKPGRLCSFVSRTKCGTKCKTKRRMKTRFGCFRTLYFGGPQALPRYNPRSDHAQATLHARSLSVSSACLFSTKPDFQVLCLRVVG